MTEIIGIDHPDNTESIVDRAEVTLNQKGVILLFGSIDPTGADLDWQGMANKRMFFQHLEPIHCPEDEIEPRSISIANEVEAAIRQARDPEVVE